MWTFAVDSLTRNANDNRRVIAVVTYTDGTVQETHTYTVGSAAEALQALKNELAQYAAADALLALGDAPTVQAKAEAALVPPPPPPVVDTSARDAFFAAVAQAQGQARLAALPPDVQKLCVDPSWAEFIPRM